MLTFHHADYADAFEQESGLVGWSQRYAQLGPGAYSGSVDTLALPGITIFRERIGVPILQEVASPPGRLLFTVPLSSACDWRVDAGTLAAGTLMITQGGREVVAVGTAASDLLMVAVDPALFGADTAADSFADPASITDRAAVQGLVDWLLALIDAHGTHRLAPSRRDETMIADLLLDRLGALASLARGRHSDLMQPTASVYRRVRDYLDALEGEPLSVAEIADATGLAPSQLRTVFAEVVGVSPSEWLKLRRLDAVRRELSRCGDRARTVSDIAMTCGFWHLGRFARTYADQFGETPSETIHRHRLA